ncbi:MAG: hypothetical protein K9L70_13840 [Thiohalocapsa sp.]|nr:hypothetical protein [Thiohalocapsa sp.]MCF7989820.1 hypothetical protein [Thiohalocapsa sp.]
MARLQPTPRTRLVLSILQFFLDLCMLRRNPQDLPASNALFGLVLAAGLIGGLLLAVAAGASPLVGLGQTALDFLLMFAALHLALKLMSKPERFLQTATALVGADTLIGLVALTPISFVGPSPQESPELLLVGLVFLALVVWSVVVTGHILRHAFGLTLGQGAAIAIAFDVLSFVVVGSVAQGAG